MQVYARDSEIAIDTLNFQTNVTKIQVTSDMIDCPAAKEGVACFLVCSLFSFTFWWCRITLDMCRNNIYKISYAYASRADGFFRGGNFTTLDL